MLPLALARQWASGPKPAKEWARDAGLELSWAVCAKK
jgi:hypothetical protein